MWRSLNPAATRLHKNLHRLGFRNHAVSLIAVVLYDAPTFERTTLIPDLSYRSSIVVIISLYYKMIIDCVIKAMHDNYIY